MNENVLRMPFSEKIAENEFIHILHVDDEQDFLESTQEILQMNGPFLVEPVGSVEEAEKKLEEKEFDIIISDYIMPGKDGLEFLRWLRARGDNTPFIIFTGKGREIVAIRALNLGADQYVNKLGDRKTVYSELIYSITKLVDIKNAQKELKISIDKLIRLNEKLDIVGRFTRHDIRNKICILQNNIYLIEKTLNDHKALEYVHKIQSNINQINKILDFACTFQKVGDEALSPQDVGECFDSAFSLISDLDNVDLINSCHGLIVQADSILNKLFYNLIDNSLKHGENVTQIKMYYVQNDQSLKLFYEDNGIGIPENRKTEIFSQDPSGLSGFGLFLIKKMCDTYDWTIKETGQATKGVKFQITIPCSSICAKKE